MFSTRFTSKFTVVTNGCWLWSAALNRTGYGQYWDSGKLHRAHKFSYEKARGAVPEGLVLDHLCGFRNCVNPNHLEPVTQAVNVQRGNIPKGSRHYNKRKTHCKYGHKYTAETTYIFRGWRQCKVCNKGHSKRYYRNKKELK